MKELTPIRKKYLKQFEARRNKMRKLLDAGLSYSEVARAMNVSRQRVRNLAAQMKVSI